MYYYNPFRLAIIFIQAKIPEIDPYRFSNLAAPTHLSLIIRQFY